MKRVFSIIILLLIFITSITEVKATSTIPIAYYRQHTGGSTEPTKPPTTTLVTYDEGGGLQRRFSCNYDYGISPGTWISMDSYDIDGNSLMSGNNTVLKENMFLAGTWIGVKNYETRVVTWNVDTTHPHYQEIKKVMSCTYRKWGTTSSTPYNTYQYMGHRDENDQNSALRYYTEEKTNDTLSCNPGYSPVYGTQGNVACTYHEGSGGGGGAELKALSNENNGVATPLADQKVMRPQIGGYYTCTRTCYKTNYATTSGWLYKTETQTMEYGRTCRPLLQEDRSYTLCTESMEQSDSLCKAPRKVRETTEEVSESEVPVSLRRQCLNKAVDETRELAKSWTSSPVSSVKILNFNQTSSGTDRYPTSESSIDSYVQQLPCIDQNDKVCGTEGSEPKGEDNPDGHSGKFTAIYSFKPYKVCLSVLTGKVKYIMDSSSTCNVLTEIEVPEGVDENAPEDQPKNYWKYFIPLNTKYMQRFYLKVEKGNNGQNLQEEECMDLVNKYPLDYTKRIVKKSGTELSGDEGTDKGAISSGCKLYDSNELSKSACVAYLNSYGDYTKLLTAKDGSTLDSTPNLAIRKVQRDRGCIEKSTKKEKTAAECVQIINDNKSAKYPLKIKTMSGAEFSGNYSRDYSKIVSDDGCKLKGTTVIASACRTYIADYPAFSDYRNYIKTTKNKDFTGDVDDDTGTIHRQKGCIFSTTINYKVDQKFYNTTEDKENIEGYSFYYKPIDYSNPFPNGLASDSLWKGLYTSNKVTIKDANNKKKEIELSKSFETKTYVATNLKLSDIRNYNKNNLYTSWKNMNKNGTSKFIGSTYGVSDLGKIRDSVYALGCGPANADWEVCKK